MSESKSHRDAKNRADGKLGRKEVSLKSGRRVDALTPRRATEVERGGTSASLVRGAARLKASHEAQNILQVPDKDFAKAAAATRKACVSGTVKNMSATKRRSVK
jgi:hypothetical protein